MYLQIPLFKTSYTTDRCVRKDVCRGKRIHDLQATKAGNQRSQGSYPGFRPRQSPARPKPWYNAGDLRAFLCLPGVAGPLKATKAGNQRSRNSYPGVPATTEPTAAKSQVERKMVAIIYARFCVSLARRARGKQPRPETSVAGTAIPDSGNDKAQR